jgi:hypothetical protein
MVTMGKGKFLYKTAYSNYPPTEANVQEQFKKLLGVNGSDVDKQLQAILKPETPITLPEKRRILRLREQMGPGKLEHRDILKLLLDKNTYVYTCGILDVEQTVRNTLLLIAFEAKKLEQVRQHIDWMKQDKVNQWRTEGVRQLDRDQKQPLGSITLS